MYKDTCINNANRYRETIIIQLRVAYGTIDSRIKARQRSVARQIRPTPPILARQWSLARQIRYTPTG